MEEGLLKASMPGFFGGENSDWPQHALLPYQCRRIVNAVVEPSGVITSRGGVKKINPTTLVPGQPIRSGYRYYNPISGIAQTLVQAGRYIFVLADNGTATQLQIGPHADKTGGGMTHGAPVKWQTVFATSKCLFSNGDLYQYDGTTATKVSATSAPAQIMRGTENLDKFWCWSKDQPNHVYRSPQQSVTDAWDALDYSPVRPVQGDSVVDLATIGKWVLVLKGNSLWRFDGSTKYDLAREIISDSDGLLGDTAAMYQGAAIWLSQNGVVYLDGGASDISLAHISKNKINKTLGLYPDSMLAQAVGCFYPKQELYLLSLPFMSPATVFTFSFKVRDPSSGSLAFPVTRWEMPFKVTSMWVAGSKEDNGQLYFGSADGDIYLADYGTQDDGQPIPGWFETSYSTLINSDNEALPDRIKNVRHMLFEPQILGPVTLELLGDYEKCLWPADGNGFISSSYADPDALVMGTDNWGEKNFYREFAPMRSVRISKFNASRVALRASWSSLDRVVVAPPTVRYFSRDPRRKP